MKAFAVALALLLFCCAAPRRTIVQPPKAVPPRPPVRERVQYGWASWYGEEFHGRRTASGQVYDMYDLTAAHRTLPFGTRVMVTHLKKGRSVVVTVNDRGPFVKGRIIDLSYAAARVLGMVEEGVAWVRVEVVSWPGQRPLSAASFTVQVGSFSLRANAYKLAKELSPHFRDVRIVTFDLGLRRYWRVRVGSYRTRQQAELTARRLAQMGYDVVVMPE